MITMEKAFEILNELKRINSEAVKENLHYLHHKEKDRICCAQAWSDGGWADGGGWMVADYCTSLKNYETDEHYEGWSRELEHKNMYKGILAWNALTSFIELVERSLNEDTGERLEATLVMLENLKIS